MDPIVLTLSYNSRDLWLSLEAGFDYDYFGEFIFRACTCQKYAKQSRVIWVTTINGTQN